MHPEGTLLRHATSTPSHLDSVEQQDPALASAARRRMEAFLAVVCVAYAASFAVEQAMRSGLGVVEFTNLKLTQNFGAAVVSGLALAFLRKSACSFRTAARLTYGMVVLIGLHETAQSLRIFEWPRAWPSIAEIAPDLQHSLVSGLPWTCFLLALYPPFLPGSPRKHFFLALAVVSPLLCIPALWSTLGDVPFSSILSPITVSNLPVCIALSVAISMSIDRVNRALLRERRRSRELGSYELVRELGRGGMGEVWLARHKMLARPAALKLIKFDRVHGSVARASQVLRRFEREAKATAMLRSAHTVEIYDFGRTDNGDFYYVMELLDGLDLDALVERHGPQPVDRVVKILVQACLSLEEAHAHGIIHRDIKPANVFLCRQGSEVDVVKVLDFGLVAQVSEDKVESHVTRDGDLVGTPAFMAPEMVTSRRDVDHRADLYALACVGYWLLTGRLLFPQETPMEMAIAHVHAPLPSPLFGDLGVDPGLEQVFRKALAKAPTDRPKDARAFIHLLSSLEVGDPWTEADQRSFWESIPPVVDDFAKPSSDE